MIITREKQQYSIECFDSTEVEGKRVVMIDDRYYRLYRDGDLWYFMVQPLGHPRSVRGSWEVVVEALVDVHHIYKTYERRVRMTKAEAQSQRDRRISEVAESVSVATKS